MKVGFIGLGNMGEPIARNLLRGNEVVVYNRTQSRAQQLEQSGARAAGTPAEAAARAEVVITMLADDQAVEEVVFGPAGFLEKMPRGAVHISMSTISVALAERLARAHAEHGQEFISAPVFGRPEAAAARKLFVVAAGPRQVVDRCRPLLDAIGQRTFVAGEKPAAANVVKIAGNFLIAAMIESLGEAMALARKHDVTAKSFLEVITESIFPAPIYRSYGERIAAEQFEPAGFRLVLGLKDVKLALAAGENAAVPMPVASVVRDHALSGIARGMADIDWAAIARVVAEDAGLQPVEH